MKLEIELDDKIHDVLKEQMAEPFGVTVEDVISALLTQMVISFATHPEVVEELASYPVLQEGVERAIKRAQRGKP